jgi:hypothetical protein
MLLGTLRRIRFARIFSELIPEFNNYEKIDLVLLLISYYNSAIILGVPLFCLGITITHSLNAFIINLIIWAAFFIYSAVSYRRVQINLKSKGIELNTLHKRVKDKEFYAIEKKIAEIRSLNRKNGAADQDRDYRQVRKKVA